MNRSTAYSLLFYLSLLSFFSPEITHAADMDVHDSPPGAIVTGIIVPGDADQFVHRLQLLKPGAKIILQSPGGNLLAGLRIGEFIRAKDFETMVAPGHLCASACALIWLGG